MAKKFFILDTSVYLTDANVLESYGTNNIIIPLKVLDEIDKHKKRQDLVGTQARSIIRKLDKLRSKGNLFKGVRIGTRKGLVSVKKYDPFCLPDDLDLENADNQIIAVALTTAKENPDKKVILVSRDINMRVKCDSLGIMTEDYCLEPVVADVGGLYSGYKQVLVDDELVNRFYEGEDIVPSDINLTAYPNQFIMLVSSVTEKKTALARYVSPHLPLVRPYEKKGCIWSLKPRNKEQSFALDLLMDEQVPVVSLIGRAGSGKTILALAAALEQVFTDGKYNKIVVTKPVQPVGKDLGFLPGTLEEKMMPWLAPIQDNLQFLFGNDKLTLDMHIDKGTIEVEAMTYIRGRSISNTFIIIDEVQNMTQHEIKTVLTRVGEGTKIVLTGDIEQIDNVYIDATNNGLSYVIEKMKSQEISGHITLIKGERSKVATISSKIL